MHILMDVYLFWLKNIYQRKFKFTVFFASWRKFKISLKYSLVNELMHK